MICDNCLHYEVCSIIMGEENFEEIRDLYGCKNFEDKSYFIRKPCKIGDKFYLVHDWLGIIDERTCHDFLISNSRVALIDEFGLRFWTDDDISGKQLVFFSREAAEKALSNTVV